MIYQYFSDKSSIVFFFMMFQAFLSNSNYGITFRKKGGSLLFLWFYALRKTIKTTIFLD